MADPSGSPSARRTDPPPWVTGPRLTPPPAPRATGPEGPPTGPRAFPRPADLGPAWTFRTAFGGEEHTGGDVPVVRRDPQEVARAAVPRGCARTPASERSLIGSAGTALRAAEVAYEVAGEWVDAVRVQFDSPRDAARFADARREALRDCRGRGAGSAVGPLVTRVVDVDAVTVLSDRTPESDAYSDLAVLDGGTIVLVSRRSGDTPTLRDARALAAGFTGSRVPGGIN